MRLVTRRLRCLCCTFKIKIFFIRSERLVFGNLKRADDPCWGRRYRATYKTSGIYLEYLQLDFLLFLMRSVYLLNHKSL